MSSVSDQPGEGGGWDDVFAADSMDGSFDALGTGASPAPQNQSWDLVLADLGAHDHAYDLLPLDAGPDLVFFDREFGFYAKFHL